MIIIDSALKFEDAIRQNPTSICPDEILQLQRIVDVKYYSFDGILHEGQVVIDKDLVRDIDETFILIKKIKFPIASVIPISHSKFHWDDEVSMQVNNSSGFNYRTIARTEKLSNHAFGHAIDLNPLLNPFMKGDFVRPKGAKYDPSKKGTIVKDSEIVLFLKSRGWTWGGDWEDRKDYQHFEKPLKMFLQS